MVGEVTVVVLVLSEALAGVAELGGKEALLLQQLRELAVQLLDFQLLLMNFF